MTSLSLWQQMRLGLSPKGGRRRATLPNQLSGLEFWYDAAESPVVETAGAIERWDDLSGNANHAGQSTAGSRPVKVLDAAGRSVIRFDGSDDSLDVTTPPSFASGVTMFVVFRMRQRVDFTGIVSASAAAGTDHVDFFTFQNASAAGGNFQLWGRSPESDPLLWQLADDGGLYYAIFALGGGSGVFRSLGGTASDTYDGSFGTPDEIVLGARFNSGLFGHSAVDLLEVGLYSHKLSGGQIGSLEAHLLDKYQPALGIQAEASFVDGDLLGPDWTFSRSSAGAARDHEGIYRQAGSGELRLEGLRRVENLFPSSASPATQTPTVVVGARYAFHFRDGGGSGSFALTGAATATVDEGEAYSFTATTTTLTATLSGTPGAGATVQLEETSGLASAAPSEYVDSATTYNAKVAGVRYLATTNGNGFTAPGPGTVTEATGSAIAAATLKGALLEPQRTNQCHWSYDLTQWLQIGGLTTALDEVGIDGRQSKATTLTDSNASDVSSGQIGLSGLNASGTYTMAAWVKKDPSATASVSLNADYFLGISGAFHIVLDPTDGSYVWASSISTFEPDAYGVIDDGDWWIVYATHTGTGADTTINFRVYPALGPLSPLGNLDLSLMGSCVVGQAKVVEEAILTSPILTNGSTATRLADSLVLPAPGVTPGEIGIEMGFELPNSPAGLTTTLRLFGSDDATGTTEEIRTLGAAAWAWTPETGSKGGTLEIDVGDLSAGTPHTLGLSLTDSEQVAVLDGNVELDDSQSLALAHSDTELQIGSWDGAALPQLLLRSFSYWIRDVVRGRIGG